MHFKLACVIKAGTLGCVFIDNETHSSGFACRAFSDTTRVCFIVNEHTTKCSRNTDGQTDKVIPVYPPNYPHCNSYLDPHITTKFGTCHDSTPIVACAESGNTNFVKISIRTKWIFHQIRYILTNIISEMSHCLVMTLYYSYLTVVDQVWSTVHKIAVWH